MQKLSGKNLLLVSFTLFSMFFGAGNLIFPPLLGAQAGRDIPCYGTTHADYIYGEVPCLRCLTREEIDEAYEKNTGLLIVHEFKKREKDVKAVPAVLCKNHGPFTWGKDGNEAVHNAVVLEECAKMAFRTELINPQVKPAPQELQDKHYYRKHGANAYYGQKA